VEDERHERQLNIHLDPEHMAGVYANFANVSYSDYEFTITFARVDHEIEEGDVPGVVVARVNMSTQFMRELLDAMQDTWSKYTTVKGIQNLPETPPREG
jgi:ABC-type ATPase with predicted acetyltransferase domain